MPKAEKPNLYRGEPLRLLALDSDGFEDFVYATLSELGPLHGIRIVGGPSGSSDAGFDAEGVRLSDQERVAIQCKRLASTFHLNAIAAELAKVALTSAVGGYLVREHLIVVAAEVGGSLRKALRQSPRSTLASNAADAAADDPNLKTLRASAVAAGLNPKDVAERYVLGLEHLRVWSGREFDQELGRIWTKILPVVERAFAIEQVLREHPRPDFERDLYLQRCCQDRIADRVLLVAIPAALPPKLLRTRGEDPLSEGRNSPPETLPGIEDLDLMEALRRTSAGTCTVLCGVGGSGKTTTLVNLRADAAEIARVEEDQPLPVLVRLSGYLGSLANNIKAALRINYGAWASIPGRILLLLDGLDEVPSGLVQAFLDELDLVLEDPRVSAVVTVRRAGLRQPVALSRFGDCWELQPITFRQSIQLAQAVIPEHLRPIFLDQLRLRLGTLEQELIFRPFGFATACAMFLETKALPDDSESLLEGILRRRFQRNRMRAQTLAERLRDVPDSTVRELAEEVAFAARVQKQRASLAMDEWHLAVAKSMAALRAREVVGSTALSDLDAQALLLHYEFADQLPEERIRVAHDVVADFLAARKLATSWSEYRDRLQQTIGDDAWLYAARHISETQRAAFLETVYQSAPILAAWCARLMGPSAGPLIESLVFETDKRDSALSVSVAASCMGIVGTEPCIDRLRANRASHAKTTLRWFHATRALAWHGDVPVLKAILDEEEPGISSGLGVTSSGLDMWRSAPAFRTLDIARARIDGNPSLRRGVLAIRTIQGYGDNADVGRVDGVVRKASSMPMLHASARCLYVLAPKRCVEVLTELAAAATSVGDKLAYVEMLVEMSTDLDLSAIVDELINELIDGVPADQEGVALRMRIVSVVNRRNLPEGAPFRIRGRYDTADKYLKSELWQIATRHNLASFDELSFLAFHGADPDEAGTAANFAMVRDWKSADRDRFATLCIERCSAADGTEWFAARLLTFLLLNNMREKVAAIVLPWLTTFCARHNLAQREFRVRARSGSGSESADMETSRLALALPPLVVVAAEIADLIPPSVSRDIAVLDLSSAGDKARAARRLIAERVSAEDIDSALVAIDDPEDRIPLLDDLSGLGPTPTRIALLCKDLPSGLHWPTLGSPVARVVDKFWSAAVAEAAIETIATVEWDPRFGAQFARELADVVASRMTKQIATELVVPRLARVMNRESAEILTWWHELGMRKRD